jgi:hypothetical protein
LTDRRAWLVFAAGAAIVLLAAVPAFLQVRRPESRFYAEFARLNTGLAPACTQHLGNYRDLAECRTSDRPAVAVWGDSMAMQLVPGLRAEPQLGESIIQLTRIQCAPVIGATRSLAPSWSEVCLGFSRDAFHRIVNTPSIRYVILAGSYRNLLAGEKPLWIDGGPSWDRRLARRRLVETIVALKRAGKVPIIFAPLPINDFDPFECNLRRLEALPAIGRDDCRVRLSAAPRRVAEISISLRAIAAATGTPLLDPQSVLCSGDLCDTMVGRSFVYRDMGHMTHWGSRYLFDRLNVAGVLDGRAE